VNAHKTGVGPARPTPENESSSNVQPFYNASAETARQYLARGWAAIPIPPRSKAAKITGWVNLRITEADLTEYFRDDSNIGVLNGEPSGWLIDIDLDHPLARELADDFLPATKAEFGRASARRSHRLYVVNSPVETNFRRLPKVNGKSQMIVELRSTGSQTVFPGSIHPSGE
jgi:Bifunctional DNA primase/polymerase, N-terminal